MNDQESAAIKLMERIGGGFASALAVAWQKADAQNQWRLRVAFDDLLQEYINKAKLLA